MDFVMTEQPRQSVVANGDVAAALQVGTLWGLFCECVRRYPVGVAYRDYDPVAGNWRDHTWQTIAARVDRFRTALAREKLKTGDRVAILLPNGIDWVCLDMAAHASGLVVVGLPARPAASNAYILGHSDARLILLDTEARWKSLWPFRSEFPSLERMIRDIGQVLLRQLPNSSCGNRNVLANTSEPPSPHPAAPHPLAHTSGTTGKPAA
jgi:long-chain acyl-CoA synthetase